MVVIKENFALDVVNKWSLNKRINMPNLGKFCNFWKHLILILSFSYPRTITYTYGIDNLLIFCGEV